MMKQHKRFAKPRVLGASGKAFVGNGDEAVDNNRLELVMFCNLGAFYELPHLA